MRDKIEIFLRFVTAAFLFTTVLSILLNTLTVHFVSIEKTRYFTEVCFIFFIATLFFGYSSILVRKK